MRMCLLTPTVIFLMFVTGLIHADSPATQPAAGTPVVTGTLGKPEATAKAGDTAKIASVLGHHGVLFIRSEARWDELNKLLPDLTPDTPLPNLDFAKQSVVLVYRSPCRPADTLSLTKHTVENFDHGYPAPDQQLDFLLRWDNGLEKHLEYRSAKFILAIIPATSMIRVTVSSEPAVEKQPKVVTEFSAILGGSDGGDIVDGLQAAITPKVGAIKPGEDILIDLELHLAHMPDAHPAQFGTVPESVYVWNATFPEGYQRYSYLVTTPDGETRRFHVPERMFGGHNPNAIEITSDKLYHLADEGDSKMNYMSLKEHRLNTTTPGTYIITALYEEGASAIQIGPDPGKAVWGGSITSNTITVEVKN